MIFKFVAFLFFNFCRPLFLKRCAKDAQKKKDAQKMRKK